MVNNPLIRLFHGWGVEWHWGRIPLNSHDVTVDDTGIL